MFVLKRFFLILAAGFFLFCFIFLIADVYAQNNADADTGASFEKPDELYFSGFFRSVSSNSQLPQQISEKIQKDMNNFITDLSLILKGDPFLRILVDKKNPVALDYEPNDIVDLRNDSSYRIISAHKLRRAAVSSLEEMAAAAKNEGVVLTVLSAYRPYLYQSRIYTYYVVTMGQAEADKISARPGHSQHQLGFAVDFNNLDNELALTAEGIWLKRNASRFGWSISYPEGYEDVTGYDWESWHYRYVGRELAGFIDKYFDGVQQYALRFIKDWEQVAGSR